MDGGYYPLEVHLVHLPPGKSPFYYDTATLPSEALVIGLFVTVGKANKIFDIFTHHTAEEVGHIYKAVNPYDLLPKGNRAYWCVRAFALLV